MIGSVAGTVQALRGTYCIVLCGGIGYKVAAPKQTLAALSLGTDIEFWTHLAVREDALDLYGFTTEEDLRFFELLLTVSGIGPKSALAILDVASIETLRSAITHGKAEHLTKMSGVGRKTAEKIVLELRDKAGIAAEGTHESLRGDEDALEAMRSLGYTHAEAREALRTVPAEIKSGKERLREALKLLGQPRS